MGREFRSVRPSHVQAVTAVLKLPPRPPKSLCMLSVRSRLISLLVVVCAFAAPASAHAAPLDLAGFRFTSALLFVNENAGDAVITVTQPGF